MRYDYSMYIDLKIVYGNSYITSSVAFSTFRHEESLPKLVRGFVYRRIRLQSFGFLSS